MRRLRRWFWRWRIRRAGRDAIHEVVRFERDTYREALETIKRDYGQVCGEFQVCDHPACYGSCGAWMTAEEALDRVTAARLE